MHRHPSEIVDATATGSAGYRCLRAFGTDRRRDRVGTGVRRHPDCDTASQSLQADIAKHAANVLR